MNKLNINGMVSGVVLAGALGMGMAATTAAAGWSANVAMTTEYRWRGVSQSDDEMAIQGGFDYDFGNGFYVGTWASNVDWDDDEVVPGVDGAQLELDLYGGYGGEIGSTGIGYDVGVIRYMYPGADSSFDYDTTEIYGGLTYSLFSAYWYHTSDAFGVGDSDYLNVAVDYEFDNGVGIGASYGDYDFDDINGADYNDWKLYVSKEFGGFGFELSYVDTDISGCGSATVLQCDSQMILSVSKSFE